MPLMLHLRGAVIGIVAFLGIVIGAIIVLVYMGYAPMMADSAPSPIEANLAMKAVHAVSERQMGDKKSPLPSTPEVLSRRLGDVFAELHHVPRCVRRKPLNIAAGFYVPAPQFATDGAEDDPEGATYWKIHHGIRFSAMPAFMHALSDDQI